MGEDSLVAEGSGERLWLELPIGLVVWRVYLAPAEHPKLDGDDGATHYAECVVYLRETLSLGGLVETLGHELVHAAKAHFTNNAARAVYGHASEGDDDSVDDVEEAVACMVGSRLLEGLVRGGYLRLPEVT